MTAARSARLGTGILGSLALIVALLTLAPLPPGHATDGRDFAGGFSWDNGPAASAMLNFPTGVAFDGSGNLLIGDTNNRRVRKVAAVGGLVDPTGDVSDLGSLVTLLSGPMACDASPTAIVEEQLSSPGSTVFRYDATTNQFIYDWQSSSGWRGCRLLQVTLSDGTQHWAKFNFK